MVPESATRYILVAEDNEFDLLLVREALKAENVDCYLHVLSDGEAAIHFIDQMDTDLRQRCPVVVLLDLYLPKHDGQAILKRLRASERCANIPVVVLTSSISAVDRRSAERHAPVHFFRKPATLIQFMELGMVAKNAFASAAGA